MDTTAIAIASAANANAAAARQAAHRAECRALMPSYQDVTATVEQRREYAECVGLLYPHELTGSALTAAKFWVLIALVSIPVGAWLGWQEDETPGAMMGAILGPCAVGAVGLATMAIIAGIAFVVNA